MSDQRGGPLLLPHARACSTVLTATAALGLAASAGAATVVQASSTATPSSSRTARHAQRRPARRRGPRLLRHRGAHERSASCCPPRPRSSASRATALQQGPLRLPRPHLRQRGAAALRRGPAPRRPTASSRPRTLATAESDGRRPRHAGCGRRAARRATARRRPTPTPPTTGDAAKQRARTDLQGRVFIRITTTTFSSARVTPAPLLGRLVRRGGLDVQRASPAARPRATRAAGRSRAPSTTSTGARASVRRDNDDGTTGFVEFAATSTQVTVNGNVVSVQTSGVCA